MFTKGFDNTGGPKSRTNVGRSCKAKITPGTHAFRRCSEIYLVNTNDLRGETDQGVNLVLVTLEGGEEAVDPTHKAIESDENEANSSTT